MTPTLTRTLTLTRTPTLTLHLNPDPNPNPKPNPNPSPNPKRTPFQARALDWVLPLLSKVEEGRSTREHTTLLPYYPYP